MKASAWRAGLDTASLGTWMHGRVRDWYPICRSITGEGLRETLRLLGEDIPVEMREVPTGTPVFDWTVPREWNITDAYIKDGAGKRVIDFREHNLHVLGYSVPVNRRVPRGELLEHCTVHPENPDLIPYRNSYYQDNWGFCMTHAQRDALTEDAYDVCIDSTLADGALSYGECYLPGASEEEFFFSAHACHPSLANDNLSGIALAVCLAKALAPLERRYSYRFLFAPGTIGAIAWLARNEDAAARMKHGLVLACVGDRADSSYKTSRRGNAEIDRAMDLVLGQSETPWTKHAFTPYGYDERQYGSPGFNLPVGCLMRSGPGGYPEYHSSGDNPALVAPEALADSMAKLARVVEAIEGNETYLNRCPKCEPQLGKRGLYGAIGGQSDTKVLEMSLLWVLNYSDGSHSLIDIAAKSGFAFEHIRKAADALIEADLLAPAA